MASEWTEERKAYMRELALEYDLPLSVVVSIADLLGPNEDYDGLLCMLEDAEAMDWDKEERWN